MQIAAFHRFSVPVLSDYVTRARQQLGTNNIRATTQSEQQSATPETSEAHATDSGASSATTELVEDELDVAGGRVIEVDLVLD